MNALLAVLFFAALTEATDFHVSPNGSDAASGSAAQPFRTLGRARDAARAAARPCRIELADGVYEADSPLVFTAADRHLEFCAAPGARPVVSAGRHLADWRVDAQGVWHAAVPRGVRFAQLYVNGQRRTRPFLPRTSYYFVEKAGGAEPGTDRERFICSAGEFPAGDNPDLEVCLFHVWTMSRARVMSYDAASRRVTLDVPSFKSEYSAVTSERWYRFDNVKSAFGAPGDWYLDTAKGEVVYQPKAGETPANCVVVASRHAHAVRLDGAEDVVFRGIVFAYGDYGVAPGGNYTAQAAWNQAGTVHAEGAKGIRLENCAVLHTGAWGVKFTHGCRDCAVRSCELYDLGAGGVAIGDGWEKDRAIVCSAACVVEDSLIEGGGRVDPAGVGVWLGHAKGCRVAHNTIHDLYYSGISLGWNWSFATTARDNLIEANHVYDIGQHRLSDMGAIYVLGRQPGTVIRGNHLHHVTRARNCAFGLYFDSGTSEVCATNNVVHDCGDCNWFMARISASNRVENNVFACGPRHQLNNPPRDPTSKPSRFAHNVVAWTEGLFMPAQPGADVVDYADNLYFCPPELKPKAARGFTYGHPGFRNLETRDFDFVDAAAARAVGFVPFTLAGCGRTSPRRFTAGAAPVPAVFFPAPKPPIKPVAEDFEALPVGGTWQGWKLYPAQTAPRLVTVTDRTAAQGKRSLEVVDSLADWAPHFYCNCLRESGTVRASFALKVSKGAYPVFEARDYGVYPGDGPRPMVSVAPDGWLRAGGTKLVQVPADVWLRVAVEFPLGRARATNEYVVRVRLPGDAADRVYPGQPLGRNFTALTWLGFTSNASNGARYWLDDFRLTP